MTVAPGGAEHAARVNAAADLLEAGVAAAEAARVLAGRLGCSARQARRYVDQAGAAGPVPVPEPGTVFTVKLPGGSRRRSASMPGHRAGRSRRSSPRPWRNSSPGAQEPSAQVNGKAVEAEFVFGRHAAADLSVAYAILVPQRRARTARAGQEGQAVTSAAIYARVSSARQKKDQTIGSQIAGAARPRRAEPA